MISIVHRRVSCGCRFNYIDKEIQIRAVGWVSIDNKDRTLRWSSKNSTGLDYPSCLEASIFQLHQNCPLVTPHVTFVVFCQLTRLVEKRPVSSSLSCQKAFWPHAVRWGAHRRSVGTERQKMKVSGRNLGQQWQWTKQAAPGGSGWVTSGKRDYSSMCLWRLNRKFSYTTDFEISFSHHTLTK